MSKQTLDHAAHLSRKASAWTVVAMWRNRDTPRLMPIQRITDPVVYCRRMRFATFFVALVLATLLPLSAHGEAYAPPAVTTVKVLKAPGGAGGRITAAWMLSPGVDLVRAEVATKPGRDSFGMFQLLNQVDWGDFDGPRRSWTSRLLKPGTYYFHVGAEDHEAADPDYQWSKTRRVTVAGTPVRGGRYVGTTSQGQRIRILTDRLRTLIKELTVTVRVRCGGVTRTISVSAGDTVAIRSSGTFSGTIRQPGQPSFLPAGSVTGRFDAATKVVGAIRLDYGGTGGTPQCTSGTVRFSARRVA